MGDALERGAHYVYLRVIDEYRLQCHKDYIGLYSIL